MSKTCQSGLQLCTIATSIYVRFPNLLYVGLQAIAAHLIEDLSENCIFKIEFQVNASTRWEWGGEQIDQFLLSSHQHTPATKPAHISYFHRFSYNTWFEGFLAIPGATGFLQYLVGGGRQYQGRQIFLQWGNAMAWPGSTKVISFQGWANNTMKYNLKLLRYTLIIANNNFFWHTSFGTAASQR